MRITYFIILLFMFNFSFSQDKVNLIEQCKSKYDSIFKNYYGDSFFNENIKFNEKQYHLRVDTVNTNIDDFTTPTSLYVNKNNTSLLEKVSHGNFFDYYEYYIYSFLYKGVVFHERTYTCEFANRKDVNDFSNKEILEYYNKIKRKEYIYPKKALKIAKANGLKNICYQSLTSASFHNKNQDVWQIQDCSNKITTKVIEIDPKSGKVLSVFERDYEKGEKAAYWHLFNKEKE